MRREILLKTAVVGAMVSMASLLVAGQASATYIRSAVSVTTNVGSANNVENVINQSGLASNYVSGVTDFDTYNPATVDHDFAFENEWFAEETDASGQLIFDLGGVFTVDKFAFWNEDSGGILGLNVAVSLDKSVWDTVAIWLNPKDNTVFEPYSAEVFSFTGGAVGARYLKFDLTAVPYPETDYYPTLAVGEVAFSVAEPVPEPATMLLFGTGMGALGVLRSRRKKE